MSNSAQLQGTLKTSGTDAAWDSLVLRVKEIRRSKSSQVEEMHVLAVGEHVLCKVEANITEAEKDARSKLGPSYDQAHFTTALQTVASILGIELLSSP